MRIALLGDIGLFGRFDGRHEYRRYFSDISKYLHEMDLVVGNLETPFTRSFKKSGAKSAYIGADPVAVEILKYLNVKVVNLANNHFWDYGEEGANTTKEILTSNSIDYFGIDDVTYFCKSARLALSGFCNLDTNPGGYSLDGRKGVNATNAERVYEKLLRYHTEGWLNIVSMHSGLEHVNYPGWQDIHFARALAQKIPYVYYGHHPHVVQGVESKHDALILYSLGNFCFDDVYSDRSPIPLVSLSENNRQGIICILDVSEGQIKGYKTVPIYIGEDSLSLGDKTPQIPLDDYNSKLPKSNYYIEYDRMRSQLLSDYYQTRRKKRDASWYFKRLRFRYFQLLLSLYVNKINYRKYYQNFVSRSDI